ncbi:MAG: secretin N-terminal domain-containing protein [Phycisphaerales bacterium JB065]
MRTADPRATIDRAQQLFDELGTGLDPEQVGTVSYTFDEQTGNLLITADRVGMDRFTALLDQAQRLSPPERSTRLVDLQFVEAADILEVLPAEVAKILPDEPGRTAPQPSFQAVEATNSILVTAEALQHQVISEFIRRLDVLEPTDLPPLKLIQVRAADASAIARMLTDQYARRPQEIRRTSPVDIRADAATNTLIVSAASDVLPEIETFVEELNRSSEDTADRVTEIFPLKVAKASDVARAMDTLYPEPPMPVDRFGRPQPWLREAREVQVTADNASNSLIVDAPAERMPAFTALVEKLDRVELPPQAELRTYSIPRADLDAITRTLRTLASQGSLNGPAQPGASRVPVTIESEPRSRTLIVAGDESTHTIVERILSDLSAVPVERELRVIRLDNADPREVAQRAEQIYTQQTAELPGSTPVDVTVDESTNSLLVVAEAEAMSRFMRIIDQLEEQAGPPRELRMVELQHAQAGEIVAFLNDLIESSRPFSAGNVVDPVIEPIERNNTLLIAAQPGQHAIIESLIRSLDVPSDAQAGPLRILRLRTAEASGIAGVLNDAFSQRPAEERAAKPVSIRADAATNTLIVSAHPEMLPEVERLVSELNDAQSYDSDGREIRIFPLRVARAEQLARTLDQMFPEPPVPVDRFGRPMPNLREPKDVVVRADQQTNSIIVDAPANRLAGFEQLVEQLDRTEVRGNRELRTYSVPSANLDTLARTLRNLAESGGLAETASGETGFTVEADPVSRTLIISAVPEAFERIEQVIDEVEARSGGPRTQLSFFNLSKARADRIEPTVTRLLTARLEELRRDKGLSEDAVAGSIEVVADRATNTLIVTAPVDLVETAREIIAQLDSGDSAVGRDVLRVIPLRFADAAQTAPALSRTLSTADLPSGGSIEVTAAGGSNAIIVSGAETDIDYLEGIIKEIDVPSGDESITVRTVYLTNNRAELVAPVVEQLLASERLDTWMRIELLRRNPRALDAIAEVRIAAEPRVNAVIVTAPAAIASIAEELITQLDVAPSEIGRTDRLVRVLTLRNADAASVAQNATLLFEDDTQVSTVPAPTIRVDAASNSLIVRGSAEQIAQIESLASELDGATLAGSREIRTLAVDRSRIDAQALAETLRRLLAEQGNAVEVIDAADLRKQTPADDEPQGHLFDLPTWQYELDTQELTRRGILLPKRVKLIIGYTQTTVASVDQNEDDATEDVAQDAAPAPLTEDQLAELSALAQAMMAESLATADEAETIKAESATNAKRQAAPTDAERADATDITIAVDPETNSLVLIGSERATARIAELAARIQSELPAEPGRVRIIKLDPEADVQAIASIVNASVRQIGRLADDNPGGLTGRVAVIADRASSSLILSSNDTDFQTISSIIGAVSSPGASTDIGVKIYRLSNVRAQRVVDAIQDLMSEQPRGRQAQRLRSGQEISLTLVEGDVDRSTEISFGSVKASLGPSGESVIVSGPVEAIPFVDRFVSMLDQNPVSDSGLIRVYELTNAQADQVRRTLQRTFDSFRRELTQNSVSRAVFEADERTNTIIVTASSEQHEQVESLLAQLDTSIEDDAYPVTFLPVESVAPRTIERIVSDIVIGRDPARRDRISITADDALNMLIVRAPEDDVEQIRSLLAEVDRPEASELPIRTVQLDRADAESVAQSIQRFLDDRARTSTRPGQRRVERRVSVVGDRESGTLLVAASDADFEQIESLVKSLDESSAANALEFRIVQLENAKVADIIDTVENLSYELQWQSGRSGRDSDTLTVQSDSRSNSILLFGTGESFEAIETVIHLLDEATAGTGKTIAKVFRVENADIQLVRSTVEQTLNDPGASQRWWEPADPNQLRFEVDARSRSIVVIGPEDRVTEAGEFIAHLDDQIAGAGQETQTLTLSFADSESVADSLNRFFSARARMAGSRDASITAIGSRNGSAVIVTGSAEDMPLAADIAARLDQPDVSDDHRIEVYALSNGEALDISRAIGQLFPRSRTSGRMPVNASPDIRTNSIIVSAPAELLPQVEGLIRQLDSEPAGEVVQLKTFSLESARARDVAQTITATLGLTDRAASRSRERQGDAKRVLDADGNPIVVRATVTPDERSNTLLVTADEKSMRVIADLIGTLDEKPAVSSIEYRIVKLKNALSTDVSIALNRLASSLPRATGVPSPTITSSRRDNTLVISATADQLVELEKLIEQLDIKPETDRVTEFVALEYADATQVREALSVFYGTFASAADTPEARNVSITADPTTNSLVISAAETEWDGIRELITKLDSEEYDSSRRLEVIALNHADAASVAAAVQAAFDAPLRAELDRERQRAAANRGRNNQSNFGDLSFEAPSLLINTEEVVSVSAEPLTNSLVVSAGKRDLERIRQIVEQIDVPEYSKLPEPRIIALDSGKAEDIAQSLRALFDSSTNQRGRNNARRGITILGDARSNSLIVRASDDEYEQIKTLAQALQDQGDDARTTARVLPVYRQPASRLAQTIQATFAPTAQRDGETLSVQVDRQSNALIIASTKRLYDEITAVVREIDGPAPDDDPDGATAPLQGLPGQDLAIIDLENISPAEAVALLNSLGVTRPQNLDQPGLVSEQVTAVVLNNRKAIAVLAGKADLDAVRNLVESIDREPLGAEQRVAIVPLKTATANRVVASLERLLNPTSSDAQTQLARSLAEQVRRLNIAGDRPGDADLNIDLSVPTRVEAEDQSNSVIIATTKDNLSAITELVRMLDRLPEGDAVVIRIFHLSNSSAARLSSVLDDLFSQGEALQRAPGSEVSGLPTTETGRALAGEIAVTIDDRTNALIVAGREEVVALAEVLISELDSSETADWIEPRLITLRYADAAKVAETVNSVLIDGIGDAPDELALQRQVGRLRIAREREGQGRPVNPESFLESQIFAPLSSLTVLPEEQLNAIIAVGSTANVEIVAELVKQLDVEAASRDALVRVYPLRFAAADRISGVLQQLFQDQVRNENMREEDRLTVQADSRTNSLIMATSPRSFAIIENLLKTLDSSDINPTVGITVISAGKNDASQLAPRIQQIMRDRLEANTSGRPSDRDVVSIQPNEANNSLIVAASDENLVVIRELITLLNSDEASDGGGFEIFPLVSATANDMVDLLNELYVRETNRTRGSGAIQIRADSRLNAIVANGNAADIAEIRQLIQRLDRQSPTAVRDIKIIALKSSNALEMVNLLNNILSGRSIAGGNQSSRQGMILRFANRMTEDQIAGETGSKPTEAQVSSAIREQVSIQPDLRSNSVVVSAPPQMMLLIESLIEDLDSSAEGLRQFKMFTLVNADASAMRELLGDLFSLRQQGNLFVLVPSSAPSTVEPGDEDNPPSTTDFGSDLTFSTVPDERQQLLIGVDARTNSLLVSGSEIYLERVEEIIERLDKLVGTEREQIAYELKNARVEDVSVALQQFIDQEQARITRTLGPDRSESIVRQLEREVSVVGVPGSSRLIISASPRYIDKVKSLVNELDRAPAQVLIQVLLAEVTLDEENTWGVDLGVGQFGNDQFEGALTAVGVGVQTAIGVPNLAVASLDFDLLIRALEVQGRLEVLSRPQILVNDNEEALISVGEEIRVVTSSTRTDSGNLNASVEPREVGVILDVTPSISPDGYVRLDITPEISQLTTRTIQISEDFAAPIISQRRADTTVTVRNGETIVIGGLIQNLMDTRKSKVPLLSEIPLVGEIFKTERTSTTKTELLIILTPRIITNDTDLLEFSHEEIDRLSLPDETKLKLRRNDISSDSTLRSIGRDDSTNDAPKRPEQPSQQSPAHRGTEPDGFELPL